ncbi:hypothetical protein KSF78_0006145 [Schistosoma japonicum]|nr:hypothetical protein KSF78_0006145 [Schistosoma japonicum]
MLENPRSKLRELKSSYLDNVLQFLNPQILYCTAVPDLEHMTWRYQRGVLASSVSAERNSPMVLEDV